MNRVRWGILGTGRIAACLARELVSMRSEGVELAAVASRNIETARKFAEEYGIGRIWGDYAGLATDPDIDVVYVATPHSLHYENMLSCLRAGKAVLCEKPFTINAREAREVIGIARASNTFLMEAMWTRFVPSIVALRKLLASGAIGRVQTIVAGGGFIPHAATPGYLLDNALGGGALLDCGVYLVSIASMILGTPSRIQSSGLIGTSGVDEHDAIILDHPDGAMALLYISLRMRRPPDLEIVGDNGRISVAAPIFKPATLTVTMKDGSVTSTEYPIAGSGYGYQIREVSAALREGRSESAIMPLDETLSILQTMDRIREQIGLRYAGEP